MAPPISNGIDFSSTSDVGTDPSFRITMEVENESTLPIAYAVGGKSEFFIRRWGAHYYLLGLDIRHFLLLILFEFDVIAGLSHPL